MCRLVKLGDEPNITDEEEKKGHALTGKIKRFKCIALLNMIIKLVALRLYKLPLNRINIFVRAA